MKTVSRMSKKGILKLAEFEGVRATSYLDPVGKLTIGVGHLMTQEDRRRWEHKKNSRGQFVLNAQELEDLLTADVDRFEAALSAVWAGRKGKFLAIPELPSLVVDGLVSFLFNVGAAVALSDWFVKGVRECDASLLCAHISKWNKATKNGQKVVLPGLVRRRSAECRMILDGMATLG